MQSWLFDGSLDRRALLKGTLASLSAAVLPDAIRGAEEKTLYNGIRLPARWPPRLAGFTLEPMAPPYLASPPDVISIDIGRQLFVDDFLIDKTTLRRTFHRAKYLAGNPILKPDQAWEKEGGPVAMVFSDGVWHDPADKLFKMWYMGGLTRSTCLATSKDGIHWSKPRLDVKKGTNIVQLAKRDSATVWLDLDEKDPKRRFKLFRSHGAKDGWGLSLYFSADGIHWGDAVARSGPCGDRTTVFYNPFRKVWVYSLRGDDQKMGRVRHYWENANVLAGAKWKAGEPFPWIGADRLDQRRDDLKTRPQLYNLDAVAYESLLLGLFTIWRGQPNDRAKPNELCLGFSRDGFHWQRPDHRPFIPVSERHGDWNWGNVQSAGGCCLVMGDQLYFYVSGRAGVKGSPASGVCSTGLATLRRDGFASLDAGKAAGSVTTRPVTFRGKHLFVNVDAGDGELSVEVLNKDGKMIEPFTRANCVPIRADSTLAQVSWGMGKSMAGIAGKPVRFRFHLKQGRLYAFWVSPEKSGASHGYVAAGGPGYTGPTDTVGSAAFAQMRIFIGLVPALAFVKSCSQGLVSDPAQIYTPFPRSPSLCPPDVLHEEDRSMRGRSFIASLALIGAGLMLATTARAQDPTVLPMPRPGGWAVTADNVTLIVSVTDKAELAYVDTTTMKEVKRVSLDFKPTSLALRGKTLFAATKGSALVHILDAASGKENKEIKVPGDGVRQLECHPTKGHVFAATMSNEIFAIEPESGEVTKTPARGQFLAIDPKDGSALYTGTQQPFRDQMEVRGGPGGKLIITFDRTGKRATLLKYSVKGKELKLVAGNNDTAINGKAVRVTPDGAKVAMIGGGGWESKTDRKRKYIVPLYTSKDLKDMVGEVEIGAYPIDLAFHPVLKICAGCKTGQALILFNSKSLAELKTISPIRKDSLLMDPVLLTFAGRGTKMVYWCPAGVQKQGQGALLFYDLTLNDEQKADLAKAYGKK